TWNTIKILIGSDGDRPTFYQDRFSSIASFDEQMIVDRAEAELAGPKKVIETLSNQQPSNQCVFGISLVDESVDSDAFFVAAHEPHRSNPLGSGRAPGGGVDRPPKNSTFKTVHVDSH